MWPPPRSWPISPPADLTPDELDDLRREVPAIVDLLRRDV